jgi:uncharacterized protein (DUF2345 family)
MTARDLDAVLAIDALATSSAPESIASTGGATVGQIVGFKDNGATPLVIYAGQAGTSAIAARAIVDLHGDHIGRDVVMMFENGNPMRPIVMGCVCREGAPGIREEPGQVEVDADGERLVVTAKERIVLRCGKASITLTKAGKVLIEGAYLLSRSSGVNRIKGGSVQLN